MCYGYQYYSYSVGQLFRVVHIHDGPQNRLETLGRIVPGAALFLDDGRASVKMQPACEFPDNASPTTNIRCLLLLPVHEGALVAAQQAVARVNLRTSVPFYVAGSFAARIVFLEPGDCFHPYY